MTKLQEILYQLLREIHEICIENEIVYMLHPQLVLYLQNGLDIPEDQESRCVYMTSKDMHRFISVCDTCLPQNRYIESLHSNSMYPYLYNARYGNTETFYLDINEGTNYINNGIFIRIEVLRFCSQAKIKKKFLTILEAGWYANTYQYTIRFSGKDLLAKAIVRCMLLFGRKNLSRWLYSFTLKAYQHENQMVVVSWRNTNLILHQGIFELSQLTFADASTFCIPAGWRDYLQSVFKGDYMQMLEKRYIVPISTIENPFMSGNYFFKAYPKLRNFLRQRMKLWKVNMKNKIFGKYRVFCWEMVNMASDKYKLKKYYEENLLRILSLRKDKNWNQLMIIFEPYYRTQERYAKYKQTFSIDTELDKIYYETLCYNGKKKFAERMQKYL